MNVPVVIENEADAKAYVRKVGGEAGLEKVDRFGGLLLEENTRQNLVSARSAEMLWQRHLADSAQLLEYVPRETTTDATLTWLDLGAGPGLPGLVIAILRPDYEVKLVESRSRRVEFMNSCVAELLLKNCEVIGDRLERIDPFPASVISARAFAPLPKLLDSAKPFSTADTVLILPKGRSARQEHEALTQDVRHMFHVEQSLTDAEAGIIVGRPSAGSRSAVC